MIYATKKGEIIWKKGRDNSGLGAGLGALISLDTITDYFSAQFNDKRVFITRTYPNSEEDATSYAIRITNSNNQELYAIDENNLFDGEEGLSSTNLSGDHTLLSRLYRLAERKANNIDNIMDDIVKGLSDPDDELPF